MTYETIPTLEAFTEVDGTTFTVHGAAGATTTLTLRTVDDERDTVPEWERFRLAFEGEDPLEAGTYRFEHPDLGTFEAALVPVWVGDPDVPGYEAVVERQVPGREPTHRPASASRRGFLGRALAVAVAGTLLGGAATAGTAGATTATGLSAEPYIGSVGIFAGNFAPRNWALCQGQLLPINQNTALFSILGTTYGGDGRTTFALPDLRGRVPVGTGQGAGLSDYRLGERGGAEQVTLTTDQLPAHAHTGTVDIDSDLHLPVTDTAGDETTPGGHILAGQGNSNAFGRGGPIRPIYSSGAPDAEMALGGSLTGSLTTGESGGGRAHANVQPYLAMNYCIALQGLFPPRS